MGQYSKLLQQSKQETGHNLKSEPKNERSTVPSNEPIIEQRRQPAKKAKKERAISRRTFDVYDDQYRDLQVIQLEAVKDGKKKPKLGVMVQQALDAYIKRKLKQ